MKEKIYTIPISEALEQESFCPFCFMYSSLENDAVRYTLGPAMMEPDFRIITNASGFCKKHMRELHAQHNALSLALVIDTHLDTIDALLDTGMQSDKKSLFKKDKTNKAAMISGLKEISSSCAVCSRVEHTFSAYFNTFLFMLKKEKGFLDKVLSTDGFCMEHFSRLAEAAADNLSDGEYEKYFMPLVELQKKRVEKYHKYIKNFADSFDYRNAGKKLDAPKDTLLKAGNLLNGEFEPKK